jgi:hypothetical protein
MRNYTFDFEVENMITQFMGAMDDMVVKRYNRLRDPQSQIKVRFVYAPKQRVLLDLLDKAQNIQLPVVAIYVGGISRDITRVYNKIAGSYLPTSDPTTTNKLLQPVPIDITINMSVLTRYQKDMDQILTNFIPYFDPYIVISWRTQSMPEQEIRSIVNWSNNVQLTYPTDLRSTDVARVQADTSFVIKGWMFKARPKNQDGTIFDIITTFTSLSSLSLDGGLSDFNSSRFTLSGHPQPQVLSE